MRITKIGAEFVGFGWSPKSTAFIPKKLKTYPGDRWNRLPLHAQLMCMPRIELICGRFLNVLLGKRARLGMKRVCGRCRNSTDQKVARSGLVVGMPLECLVRFPTKSSRNGEGQICGRGHWCGNLSVGPSLRSHGNHGGQRVCFTASTLLKFPCYPCWF